MTRKTTKAKAPKTESAKAETPQTEASAPLPPEQDVNQVVEAIRCIIHVGARADIELVTRRRHWPVELRGDPSPAQWATIHPIGYACEMTLREMIRHLGSMIGIENAQSIAKAFNAKEKATPEAIASYAMLNEIAREGQTSAAEAPPPPPSFH